MRAAWRHESYHDCRHRHHHHALLARRRPVFFLIYLTGSRLRPSARAVYDIISTGCSAYARYAFIVTLTQRRKLLADFEARIKRFRFFKRYALITRAEDISPSLAERFIGAAMQKHREAAMARRHDIASLAGRRLAAAWCSRKMRGDDISY